jgi:3-oxoacyl-[acyl-carrier protein] reductase
MDDVTAVVTGGTSGIGRAVAEAFAARDATVGVCGRDADGVDDTVAALEDRGGGGVVGMRADVRDEFDVERFLEATARAGDGIDVVVANASVRHGSPDEAPIQESSYAGFDDVLRTNARGTFTAFREAHPHCNSGARLLASTCPSARDAPAGAGAYAPSKAAVEAIARSFAADTDHVVGCVDPGVPAGGAEGTPARDEVADHDEIAALYVWAATECDPALLDGGVVDRDDWQTATA